VNRSTHTLFWLGLVTVGAILGAALGATLELRYRDIADARRELTSLDLLLVEETSRSLQRSTWSCAAFRPSFSPTA